MTPVFVIVPFYSGGDRTRAAYLNQCLTSIGAQDYPELYLVVVDDASPDSPHISLSSQAIGDLSRRAGVDVRDQRGGELASIITGTQALQVWRVLGSPLPLSPYAVIAHVCGDDYLPDDPTVITRLAAAYTDPDVWMTYGGYVYDNGQPGHPYEIPAEWHTARDYRARPWVASHLRSYRLGLWQAIPTEQLLDPLTGRPWFYATDRAMMLPMLELAGTHARYLPPDPPLYVYRRHAANVHPSLDQGHVARVASLPRLDPLDRIPPTPRQERQEPAGAALSRAPAPTAAPAPTGRTTP